VAGSRRTLSNWREVCYLHNSLPNEIAMRLLIQSLLITAAYSTLARPVSAELFAATNLINAVPDGGMTAIFLGGVLAVIAVLRRFVNR
jgi:hypothetical protein